ncbi:MAG TPA: universal stress protein [Candidatus Thermoplasmatota archaeon]|nr:universal stress protein [Candidatus Thermoplasmatota archaeon]
MPRKTPDVILIAVDGSKASLQAARQGFQIAKAMGASVEIVNVLVYGGSGAKGAAATYWYSALPKLREDARSTLSQAVRDAESAKVPFEAKVLEGHDAAVAIVQEAEEVHPRLIVVGSHGRTGIQRVLLGSVAEKVVRLAPCPVLVVR